MKVPPESSITSQEWINSIQKRFTMDYMMVTNPHIYTHPRFLWVNNERNVLPALWPINLKMVFLDIHRLFLLFGQVQTSFHKIFSFKFCKDEFPFKIHVLKIVFLYKYENIIMSWEIAWIRIKEDWNFWYNTYLVNFLSVQMIYLNKLFWYAILLPAQDNYLLRHHSADCFNNLNI